MCYIVNMCYSCKINWLKTGDFYSVHIERGRGHWVRSRLKPVKTGWGGGGESWIDIGFMPVMGGGGGHWERFLDCGC